MTSITIRRLRPYKFQISLALHFIVACLVASLCLVMPAHAQDASKGAQITITPVKNTVDLNPGAKYDGSFTIINSGSEAFSFTVYAAPYTVTGENYDQSFVKQNTLTQVSRWISFPQSKYSIKPGEQIQVPYYVDVPKDAPAGGQYAALFAQTDKVESQGTAVNAQKRVGMLLYGHMKGGETRTSADVQIVNPPLFVIGSDMVATARVKNTGNIDFDAKVSTTATDLFGKAAKTMERTNTVLPESTRAIENPWEKDTPVFGIYTVKTTVDALGKVQTADSLTIIIAPLFLLLMLAVLALCAGGAYYASRKRK